MGGEEEVEADRDSADPEEEEAEGQKVKIIRSPNTPTAAERAEHEVTHWPFRSWCDCCVKARATGQQHRSMKGEYAESEVARVLMDYGFLHEEETVKEGEHGSETESKVSMTVMVMLETMCSSVWAYAIEGKGATSLDWLAQQVVEDIETVGLSKERIITKTDQEASIVQLQQEVARHRKEGGTALENSRVGDSDSNGKIERNIREVKGMIRTFRAFLKEKTGQVVRLDDPIVPWIVRHAAYTITRCRVGEDGKTALQRIKGRKVSAPMIPFGETVLFKLPKVPRMPGDFKDRFETGTWVGCTTRSGEHLVATPGGVFKVSSVIRRAEDKRWSSERLTQIRGNPKEPVPGTGSSRLIAYAKFKDTGEDKKVEYMPRSMTEEPEVRVNYIFKRDVEEHGATEGCPGCRALMNPNSKYRAKHTQECRERMDAAMQQSEQGAMRVTRATDRQNLAKSKSADKEDSEAPADEEGQSKKRGKAGATDDSATASGSGVSPEERAKELEEAKKKEAKEKDDAPMQENEEVLEEAPGAKGDIRVPLAERNPATKRSRESTPPRENAKWQAYEKPELKRKPEGAPESEDNSKFQAVQDTSADAGKPADSVEKHPGPKIKKKDIETCEMEWRDVGSGTIARTFVDTEKLAVTTRG